MRNKPYPLFLLAIVVSLSGLQAQAWDVAEASWDITVRPEQICEIVESPDHQTIYLATEYGLYGVDRSTSTVERWDRQDGLPSFRLSTLAFDQDGRLWVGTDERSIAVRQSDGSWESFHIPPTLVPSYTALNHILASEDGVWIASSEGLLHFDLASESWSHKLSSSTSVSAPTEAYDLMADSTGGLYVAGSSMYRYTPASDAWENLSDIPTPSAGGRSVGPSALLQTSEGIWFASERGDVRLFDGTGWVEYFPVGLHYDCDFDHVPFWGQNPLGEIWKLAPLKGVFVYNGVDWEHQTISQKGFSDWTISSLFVDSDGKVWLGSTDGSFAEWTLNEEIVPIDLSGANIGVWKVQPFVGPKGNTWLLDGNDISAKIQHKHTLDDPWKFWPGNHFFTINITPDGEGGIWRLHDDHIAQHMDSTGKVIETVYVDDFWNAFNPTIVGDRNGGFWYEARTGLTYYTDRRFNQFGFTRLSALPIGSFRTLFSASDGTCWVYEKERTPDHKHLFSRFNGNNWETLGFDGLGSAGVSDIAVASDSIIWIASYDDGIARLSPSGIELFNQNNSNIPFLDILQISLDANGRLWLGFKENGFAVCDSDDPNGTWQTFNTENSPLLENRIRTMFPYPDGSMGILTYARIWHVLQKPDVGIVCEIDAERLLSAYPVPSADFVSICWNGPLPDDWLEDLVLTLYDGQGRLLSQSQEALSDATWTLSMKSLGPGLYHVSLSDGQHQASISVVRAPGAR